MNVTVSQFVLLALVEPSPPAPFQRRRPSIRRVPVETPLYTAEGQLARAWQLFLNPVIRRQRTLLLKDTAVGNDIADRVTVWGAGGSCTRVAGVLRRAITADLVVRLRCSGRVVGTLTIPKTTPVDTFVDLKNFAANPVRFREGETFVWDVLGSDGQTDRRGVASVTVEWESGAGGDDAPGGQAAPGEAIPPSDDPNPSGLANTVS